MEKLINLLNEFRPAVSCANFKEHYEFIDDDIYLIRKGLHEEEQFPMYVCYKKGEFIKWLVDNDKIDLEEFHRLCGIINQDSEYWNGTPQDYEQVIMYLSISDYPIEDLVSILK